MSVANPLADINPPVCTYGAYYYNKTNNSFGGNYNTIIGDYVLRGGGVMGADELAHAVNSCASQHTLTDFLVRGTSLGTTIVTV